MYFSLKIILFESNMIIMNDKILSLMVFTVNAYLRLKMRLLLNLNNLTPIQLRASWLIFYYYYALDIIFHGIYIPLLKIIIDHIYYIIPNTLHVLMQHKLTIATCYSELLKLPNKITGPTGITHSPLELLNCTLLLASPAQLA